MQYTTLGRTGLKVSVAGLGCGGNSRLGLGKLTRAQSADLVRKAIFTFVHIPKRLLARDVPKVVRIVDQAAFVTALAAAQTIPDLTPAVDHFLSNMSQRMAQSLREEMTARGKPREKEAEDAMTVVVSAIRQLEAAGELVLEKDEE